METQRTSALAPAGAQIARMRRLRTDWPIVAWRSGLAKDRSTASGIGAPPFHSYAIHTGSSLD